MDADKVKCIMEWPYQKSIKNARGFLGSIGYYRRFVKNYGVLAQPFIALFKANSFEWNNSTKLAWDGLKQATVITLVLALLNFHAMFIVESDASNHGIGVVLTQKGKLLAFFLTRPYCQSSKLNQCTRRKC